MLVTELIDDSAKEFICLAYIKSKYTSSHFMNKKYKDLVKKIMDNKYTSNNEVLGNILSTVIVCMEEFNIPEQTLIDKLKDNSIFVYMYDLIKGTDTAKDILSKAKIIHVVEDPLTGEYKETTIH